MHNGLSYIWSKASEVVHSVAMLTPHWFAHLIEKFEPHTHHDEVMAAIFIDHLNEPVGAVTLDGERHRVSLPIAEITQRAAQTGARRVLLLHTHPSGDCRPSRQDILLTRRMETHLGREDIALYDHIILAPHSYFSFLRAGLLRRAENCALPLATLAPAPYRLPPALPGSHDSGPVGE